MSSTNTNSILMMVNGRWKKVIPLLLLSIIVVTGLYFRLTGIEKNLSFWNDESHAAIYSRGVAQTGLPIDTDGRGRGIYQIGLYYVTGLSFKTFGISQTAGRLPSVAIGTLLIGVMYFVTKKVSNNEYMGLLAAILMAFSQIQLAWSTQLRPYIWLEFFSLLVAYFALKSTNDTKKIFDRNFMIGSVLGCISYLFHPIGFFNIIFLFFIFTYKSVLAKKWWYLFSIIPLSFATFILIYFSIGQNMQDLIAFVTKINTDTVHYRVFLRANYDWLLFGAMIGAISLFLRQKSTAVVVSGFIATILFLAIFKINASYVRYCLPAFPLIYFLFAYGIDGLTRYFVNQTKNKHLYLVFFFILSGVFLYFPYKKDKIVLAPKFFYTINGDMRENPIVDYQKAFDRIKQMIKGKDSVILMDAWNDRIPWYLPKQKYVWLTKHEQLIDPTFNEKMIGTIDGFEKEKAHYKRGVVIVENWESLTAPDLQKHIRDSLHHDFDVQNLPYNEADKWSISIYSWGLSSGRQGI